MTRRPDTAAANALITRLDGHLLVHPDHADALRELLDLLGEVLRHGGDDLRADIADRFGPSLHGWLVDAIDLHATLFHRATTQPSTKDARCHD
jgi:hypothetical protein